MKRKSITRLTKKDRINLKRLKEDTLKPKKEKKNSEKYANVN